MLDVLPTSAIGYVLLNSELRVVTCNAGYANNIAQIPIDGIVGKPLNEVLPNGELTRALLNVVLEGGGAVSIRAHPHVFTHAAEWRERYFDVSAELLGEPGSADALVLVRVQEVLGAPEEPEDLRSLLRHIRKGRTQPIFKGEDEHGRTVDVYVHPQARLLPDRTALLMVYRDTHESVTFEFDSRIFGTLALAHVLHGKS